MSATRETYGEQPTVKPEGMLCEVLVNLAPMDEWTGDGRRLASGGRGVRPLTWGIFAQFDNGGHEGAKLVGTMHEVSFDEGKATGRGWILDDENGRNLVRYRQAGALRTNSVDLADVKANLIIEESQDDDGFWSFDIKFDFVEWKIGATTFVPIPAFGHDADFELPELTAAMIEGPLVIDDLETAITFDVDRSDELVAAGFTAPWDAFHLPEPDEPHKIRVNPDRTVCGHLALWDSCHTGIDGSCVIPPRPRDDYGSFNQPGIPTEHGFVATGPIFFLGGHPKKPLGNGDVAAAYGGVENAWADVRVIAGRFGPWMSGLVRPGVTDEAIYAATASRTSGHWKGGDLRAIVSCNVEGYPIYGPGEIAASFTLDEDGRVAELIASFPDCMDKPQAPAGAVEQHDEPTDDFTWDATLIEIELALDD